MKDPTNKFYKTGSSILDFSGLLGLKFLAFIFFPAIMKLLKVQLISPKHSDFFRSVILSNMKQRIEKGIVRNDMIDLLIKTKNGQLAHDKEDGEDRKGGFVTLDESNVGKSTNKISSK